MNTITDKQVWYLYFNIYSQEPNANKVLEFRDWQIEMQKILGYEDSIDFSAGDAQNNIENKIKDSFSASMIIDELKKNNYKEAVQQLQRIVK